MAETAPAATSLGSMREFWLRLTPQHRMIMVLAAVAVIGLVLGLVSFVGAGSYEVLYSDLTAEDANGVVARLKQLESEFRLADRGTTVLVPTARVDELRLAMADGELPGSGHLGFELFDRNQLGMTGFTENVNLRRALEGELSRSVRALKEVVAARVHVVLPAERNFGLQQSQAKASVAVRLRPGHELNPRNVRAIQKLIAYAVQGLSTDDVVVVDDAGNLLSQTEDEKSPAQLSGDEMDQKVRLEAELSGKVASMLEPQFGAGRVSTRVSADLDFSSVQETAELVDPEARSMISEERLQESGAVQGAAGLPGVASNVGPGLVVVGPDAALAGAQRVSERRNWEISKTVRHTTQPRYRLARLSLAVVIDSKAIAQGTTPDPAGIANLVRAAVGFDERRGDQIQVQFLPFDVAYGTLPEIAGATPLEQTREMAGIYGRSLLALLLGLLGYLLFLRPLKRQTMVALKSASQQRLPAGRPMLPASAAAPLVAGATVAAGAKGDSPAERLAERVNESEAALASQRRVPTELELRDAVLQSATRNPEGTAQLIRAWIEQGERA